MPGFILIPVLLLTLLITLSTAKSASTIANDLRTTSTIVMAAKEKVVQESELFAQMNSQIMPEGINCAYSLRADSPSRVLCTSARTPPQSGGVLYDSLTVPLGDIETLFSEVREPCASTSVLDYAKTLGVTSFSKGASRATTLCTVDSFVASDALRTRTNLRSSTKIAIPSGTTPFQLNAAGYIYLPHTLTTSRELIVYAGGDLIIDSLTVPPGTTPLRITLISATGQVKILHMAGEIALRIFARLGTTLPKVMPSAVITPQNELLLPAITDPFHLGIVR